MSADSAATERRARVLLSLQRALLWMVTPSLRSVWVTWDEQRIDAEFTYDAVDDETAEMVSEVETQVIADFDDQTVTNFVTELTATARPRDVGVTAAYVYGRYEE